MLLGLGYLILSVRDRADPGSGGTEGVGEGYVCPMREQLLRGFGVTFDELASR
jgi:hypothetical protein